MRYLLLEAIAFISMVFTSALSPNFTLLGVQGDILFAVMLAMVYMEKRLTPVLFAALNALIFDSLFARAIGFYTLQYLVAGLFFYLMIAKREDSFLVYIITAEVTWILKEVFGVLLCMLTDNPMNLWTRLRVYSLPGLVIHLILFTVFYLIFSRVYRLKAIRPSTMIDERDF